MPLAVRQMDCDCGFVMDRDLNAAINIRRWGKDILTNEGYSVYNKENKVDKAFIEPSEKSPNACGDTTNGDRSLDLSSYEAGIIRINGSEAARACSAVVHSTGENMKPYICYLAGPITGKSFDDANDWREQTKRKLNPQIAGMSPFRGKTYLSQEKEIKDTYEDIALSSAKGITARDFNDCRRADMVLANLAPATQVSIGTVMEISWAKAFNVPVVVVMDETNCHWHAMIRESVGFIVPTLEEAIHIVNAVLIAEPEVNLAYSDKVHND